MKRELSVSEMQNCIGGVATWLVVLCCAGGAAAVWKILFSGRGSINIGPFRATWGN